MSRDPTATLALANLALGQITARLLPADPPCFEVWYVYESGQNPSLSSALDSLLATKGAITLTDVDALYDHHLSPFRILARVDNVGTRISYEIDRTLSTVGGALEVTGTYARNLAGFVRELDRSTDRSVTRGTVRQLAALTETMEAKIRSVESALQASKGQIAFLQDDLDSIRLESLTDCLTGVGNRKQFEQWIEQSLSHTAQTGEPFSLLLIDIDRFKSFNDRYGHTSGDRILRLVAGAIKNSVRGDDLVARYGGDEFVVILPKCSLEDTQTVAENIRRTVAARELVNRTTAEVLGRVTVSIGVAGCRRGEAAEPLIERADRAMYQAKKTGRNRVVLETALSDDPHRALPARRKGERGKAEAG